MFSSGPCARPVATGAARGILLLAALACATLGACEQASHENIDRWTRTEKGPGKLEAAVRDPALGADLRAHAGQNLIRMDSAERVLAALADMPGDQRQAVMTRLVPRLWEDARIEGEMTRPTALQIAAKDALFALRPLADATNREAIDTYLMEWLGGGYYTGRALAGQTRGAVIMQAIGPRGATRLLNRARAVVAAPPDASGARLQVEAELLIGLAVTGSADAVGFVIDLMGQGARDPALPGRALDALYQAYVDSGARFDLADGRALVPHLDRLVALVRDPGTSNEMVNDAIAVIAAAGAPACIEALIGLLAVPLRSEQHQWVVANAALRCGKAQAIVPVAEALPRAQPYQERILRGALWEPMTALDDKELVAAQARVLLQSESWVARIIGIELLGHLGLAKSAHEDAGRLRALNGDRTVLRGWWGDQADLPRRERRPAPRLGDRASEVANQLDQLARSGQKS